jgi:hypothetical protein
VFPPESLFIFGEAAFRFERDMLKKFKDVPFTVLVVTPPKAAADLQAFVKKAEVTWPILAADSKDAYEALLKQWSGDAGRMFILDAACCGHAASAPFPRWSHRSRLP